MIHKFYIRDFFQTGKAISAGYYLEHREKNMHTHEFWEVSYVIEGSGTHHFENGDKRPIKNGDFLFISPGPAHCITSPAVENGDWVRVCNILISPDYMNEILEQFYGLSEFAENSLRQSMEARTPVCVQLSDDSGSVYRMIMNILHEYQQGLEGNKTVIENELFNLLITISRIHQNGVNGNGKKRVKQEPIEVLLKFIGANFNSPLTLEYLAEYVHFTPEYLSRYFKKHTGKNLSVFIAETRIEKAKDMLMHSNCSIMEVAEYCGYSTRNNFEKNFKKYAGMTASAYKNSVTADRRFTE